MEVTEPCKMKMEIDWVKGSQKWSFLMLAILITLQIKLLITQSHTANVNYDRSYWVLEVARREEASHRDAPANKN